MWDVFNTVATNVGVELHNIFIIVIFLGGLIFYAKDYKLGIVLHFVGFGCLFMALYAMELPFAPALILFIMFGVIMALTLYTISKASQQGAFI